MDSGPQQRHFSLQAKVILPAFAMLVILLGSTLWLVNQYVRNEFLAEATEDLVTAQAVFKESQSVRIKNLVLRFRNLPNEPRFKAVSQLGDASTMKALLTELLEELGVEALQFTGAEDNLLASVSKSRRLDSNAFQASTAQVVHRSVEEGQPISDLVLVGGRLFDAISVPATINGHLVGVLTIGSTMGNSVAREFKQLVHAEVVFLAQNQIAASTLDGVEGGLRDWISGLPLTLSSTNSRKAAIRERTFDGEPYLITVDSLPSLSTELELRCVLLGSYRHKLAALSAIQHRIGVIGLSGIVLSTSILWVVIRRVTQPLRELQCAAEGISHGDFTSRVSVTSRDECGDLAKVFNRMAGNLEQSHAELKRANDELEHRVQERTAELLKEIGRRESAQRAAEEVHQQLLHSSRLAGMAEVATGVLHNVGNALNSVNISASTIGERLCASRVATLSKAVELLKEHKHNASEFLTRDPRGVRLLGFLDLLAEHLMKEQRELSAETKALQANIDHIKQIVSMQQSYAKASGTLESLAPSELVDDAVRMASVALLRKPIEIIRQFDPVPNVRLERHKALQILVNLISNATQALDSMTEHRMILLRIRPSGPNHVVIEVSDNGVGISEENLSRIFRHGFTTKEDGHGFGLHSSANTAKTLGGTLSARSDGINQGATFSLELPYDRKLVRSLPASGSESSEGTQSAAA